jgi:hypothetical protein
MATVLDRMRSRANGDRERREVGMRVCLYIFCRLKRQCIKSSLPVLAWAGSRSTFAFLYMSTADSAGAQPRDDSSMEVDELGSAGLLQRSCRPLSSPMAKMAKPEPAAKDRLIMSAVVRFSRDVHK